MKFENSETKVSTSQNVSTSHNAQPPPPPPPTFTSFSHLIPFKMRQEFIKFLGILLYENLNLKEHVKYIENKISKNLALLKEARSILEKNALLALYYSRIHTYFNYANITWGGARRTNFKKVNSQQKHVICLFWIKTNISRWGKFLKSIEP